MRMTNSTKIEVMLHKTMSAVEKFSTDVLRFTSDEGEVFEFYHEQDCCETVEITDIVGDLCDLVGRPILVAEENTHGNEEGDESETWTFYTFGTIKGTVTIRWYGTSNGYYSESVDFRYTKPNEKT